MFFLLFFLQVQEPSPLLLTTGAAKSKVRGTLLFSLPVSKRPPGPSPVGFFYFTSDFRCFFSLFYLVVSDWTCLYLYFTQYFQIRPTFTFFAVLQNFYSILYAGFFTKPNPLIDPPVVSKVQKKKKPVFHLDFTKPKLSHSFTQ